MPSGLRRDQANTRNLHFLTWSCADRKPFLLEPGAMEFVESALEQVRRDYEFYMTGYVFMPEHIHLLMSEPRYGTVADAISTFKGSTSKRLIGERSRFWLPRYHDFNVFSEKKRIEKLKYMHRNPVERGLVTRPEDYRWSSFRHYALVNAVLSRLNRSGRIDGANRVREVVQAHPSRQRLRDEWGTQLGG